jgi:ribosome-dependent ATPase
MPAGAGDRHAGELLAQTGAVDLDEAFIALLPELRRRNTGRRDSAAPARWRWRRSDRGRGLTMRFGDFTAVDNVSFRIARGEIFGFLGSNGCGKTTTMKMLTGLLPASEGNGLLFGQPVDPQGIMDPCAARRLHVAGLLALFRTDGAAEPRAARAPVRLPPARSRGRIARWRQRFDLDDHGRLPDAICRSASSAAVAGGGDDPSPEMLILDEPTSGVDPVARDAFWQILVDLSRKDG